MATGVLLRQQFSFIFSFATDEEERKINDRDDDKALARSSGFEPSEGQNFFQRVFVKKNWKIALKISFSKKNFLSYPSIFFVENSAKKVLAIARFEPGPENERTKRQRPNDFGFFRSFSFPWERTNRKFARFFSLQAGFESFMIKL